MRKVKALAASFVLVAGTTPLSIANAQGSWPMFHPYNGCIDQLILYCDEDTGDGNYLAIEACVIQHQSDCDHYMDNSYGGLQSGGGGGGFGGGTFPMPGQACWDYCGRIQPPSS